MSSIESDDDFKSRDPLLIGILEYNCASCNSTTIPQYELACHESDNYHCRDCLTKTWYTANDEIVRCPLLACGKGCGFMPLKSLAVGLHLSKKFYDTERIDKIREQPEIMNNLIAFTREEAETPLQHIYSLFEDQVLDPVALGGVPGSVTEGALESLLANFQMNPFYTGLLEEMKAAPKLMTTPLELEEDLSKVLFHLLHTHAKHNYGNESSRWGIDLEHEEAVLGAALQNHKPVMDIKDYWEDIIKKWVNLLARRYLERLASPEDGTAKRQYRSYCRVAGRSISCLIILGSLDV